MEMLDSTRIAEINNDYNASQEVIDAHHSADQKRRFLEMLSDSTADNMSRNAINGAWGDLLVVNNEVFNLVKTAMQSDTETDRNAACKAIFSAMKETVMDWAE